MVPPAVLRREGQYNRSAANEVQRENSPGRSEEVLIDVLQLLRAVLRGRKVRSLDGKLVARSAERAGTAL